MRPWPTRDAAVMVRSAAPGTCRTGGSAARRSAADAERRSAAARRRPGRSFFPLISPILWTSAATGTPPDLHRVLDFQEVDPKTGGKVPISGNSRAVPAVWNLVSSAGRTVGVVGWWATHPAEEVNGFFVS